MRRIGIRILGLAAILALIAGCDSAGDDEPSPAPRSHQTPLETSIRGDKANREPKVAAIEPKRHDAVTGTGTPSQSVKPAPKNETPEPATPTNTGYTESAFNFFNGDAKRGFDAITSEVAGALALKKTLVIWILDKTPASASARGLAAQAIATVGREAINKARAQGGATNALSVAIVGFAKEATIVTPEPIDDLSQAASLVSGIGEEPADSPLTFTAVSKAADEFLPYRNKGYEMLFVIAADTNGRDWDKLDDVIPKLRRMSVPVYGVGNAVPFGRQPGMAADKTPSESFALERIDLGYPGVSINPEPTLTDSGYGPFGLERLCRKTDGRFFRIRQSNMSTGWNTTSDGTIDSDVLAKLAPDYVSPKEYQKLLSENKARAALVNAAKVAHADQNYNVMGTQLRTKSAGGQPVDQARIATMVGNWQRSPADRSIDVDRIYDALAPGEADRPKLTGARWQAEFDLAMGRVLAAKCRIDSYNQILATIKQGKAFSKPDSQTWMIARANTSSINSSLNKMAASAQMYLNRVIKEHPGTPWAMLAERELSEKVGWELSEQ
ncbi:MAG TPA: vWA domain-containing protein, partial [Pirellulales bacterium]|nr:vWA domain-containing protein [Pirellulales bacterium]